MDAHRTCSIWLGVGDGKMQSFRLVAYSESTADVRAFTAHTNVFSCALTGDLVYYATCTHLQFYDDQNVTKINASRFEREGCPQSCYQNYALTGTELPCTLTKAPDTHWQYTSAALITMPFDCLSFLQIWCTGGFTCSAGKRYTTA